MLFHFDRNLKRPMRGTSSIFLAFPIFFLLSFAPWVGCGLVGAIDTARLRGVNETDGDMGCLPFALGVSWETREGSTDMCLEASDGVRGLWFSLEILAAATSLFEVGVWLPKLLKPSRNADRNEDPS